MNVLHNNEPMDQFTKEPCKNIKINRRSQKSFIPPFLFLSAIFTETIFISTEKQFWLYKDTFFVVPNLSFLMNFAFPPAFILGNYLVSVKVKFHLERVWSFSVFWSYSNWKSRGFLLSVKIGVKNEHLLSGVKEPRSNDLLPPFNQFNIRNMLLLFP